MKNRLTLPLLALLITTALSTANCSTTSSVVAHQDKGVDFSKYKTYQWVTEDDAKRLRFDNPPIDFMTDMARVNRDPEIDPQAQVLIDDQMKKRGYQRAQPGTKPDFYLTYFYRMPDGSWLSSWKGVTPGVNGIPVVMYPQYDRTATYEYREGTMLLVFYDSRTLQPAWNGNAANVNLTQAPGGPNVEQAVNEILHQAPRTG